MLAKKGSWEIFEDDFARIKGQCKSRDEFFSRLVDLNKLRNKAAHPTPDVPTPKEVDFARQMREVIEQFCGPG